GVAAPRTAPPVAGLLAGAAVAGAGAEGAVVLAGCGPLVAAQRLTGGVHPLLPVAARTERAAALLAGDVEHDERDDRDRPERQTPGQRRGDAAHHQQGQSERP